jgi:hypothetical protein
VSPSAQLAREAAEIVGGRFDVNSCTQPTDAELPQVEPPAASVEPPPSRITADVEGERRHLEDCLRRHLEAKYPERTFHPRPQRPGERRELPWATLLPAARLGGRS